MLREEVYLKMAEEFQTPVGVAVSIIPKKRIKTDGEVVDKREFEINNIISKSIDRGIYQTLFRRVWDLERKCGGRRIGKHTIYKKAWKEINND